MESTDCATPCICDAGLYHWEDAMRTETKSISRLAGALALAVISSAMAIPAPGAAEERVVNVYNWSDYVDPKSLEAFTKETGIKVIYDTYDSDEILETKLLAGKTGYDVVVPGAHFLQREIKAGVLAKLDKSKLKNLGNLWDEIEKRRDVYDPGSQYSVPYMWGTTAIGINVAKVKERLGDVPLDSWDFLLKPENAAKLKDCGIQILDSPAQILPDILNYAGLNPDSRDEGDIKKAIAILGGIRSDIQKFHSSEYIGSLANGDICVAVGYSGDVLQAKSRAEESKSGAKIAYIIPKEGALMWFDGMAIPADAPHVDEAHAFIDFMQRPEISAKNSNYVSYANGNKASQAFLDEAVRNDPGIYPSPEIMAKLFVSTTADEKTQRFINRAWTNLLSGQ